MTTNATYRYGGFKDSDARELSGRIATITTHSDPETGGPSETFGPHYVCHVADKPYLKLLPATFRRGDEITPERLVALIDVASVTVHEREANVDQGASAPTEPERAPLHYARTWSATRRHLQSPDNPDKTLCGCRVMCSDRYIDDDGKTVDVPLENLFIEVNERKPDCARCFGAARRRGLTLPAEPAAPADAAESAPEVEPQEYARPVDVEGSATTAYRYGGFKDGDACELSGRIATITTHSDPETGGPGETFGPHYVCHVAGKPYLMLLPATYKAGDEITPERVVALLDVASVTVHEREVVAEAEQTRQYIDAVAAALATPVNVDTFESLMPYLTNICPDCDREITTGRPWYANETEFEGHHVIEEFVIIGCRGTRLIPRAKVGLPNPSRREEDAYALVVHEALKDPAKAEAMRPWITDTCPQCGEIAGEDDGIHLRSDGVLAVGCEGFYVINPNVIGIDSPNWQDWRSPVEPVEVEQDAAAVLVPFAAESDHIDNVGCCDEPMPAGSLIITDTDGTLRHAECARHEDYPVAEQGARADRQQVVDGWDGNSRPMVALVDPCGCKWTADGSARLSVCTPCLTRACAEQAAAQAEAVTITRAQFEALRSAGPVAEWQDLPATNPMACLKERRAVFAQRSTINALMRLGLVEVAEGAICEDTGRPWNAINALTSAGEEVAASLEGEPRPCRIYLPKIDR